VPGYKKGAPLGRFEHQRTSTLHCTGSQLVQQVITILILTRRISSMASSNSLSSAGARRIDPLGFWRQDHGMSPFAGKHVAGLHQIEQSLRCTSTSRYH
jgi:hypothetical protein